MGNEASLRTLVLAVYKHSYYLHQIHQAIQVGSIQSRDLDSRLRGKHDEGACEVLAEDLSECAVRALVLGV